MIRKVSIREMTSGTCLGKSLNSGLATWLAMMTVAKMGKPFLVFRLKGEDKLVRRQSLTNPPI